jgi:hypothetical protein
VNSGHFAIRKGGSVEARRFMPVLVEPEADRILWLHVWLLLVLDQGERRVLRVERIGRISPLQHRSAGFGKCMQILGQLTDEGGSSAC